ncbi:cytochrome P450 [Rhodococcus sp. BP-252]|uniref:cytochrome P450 n=1 Tax=unclassified Rhodococcus (in: high G+C Gram-positive bacteria) TaxID=192944 RepID=UPI001C9AD294|nr:MULTISPECIES: cytochrome P450 [unclassified Rhodococcus (in: high G+C Gram-positive bacteria)]MBY6414407.1 cytochrome P450 [Rhodococcus sp. BP-320]MBY6419784.1 cytochrome P450 [Rhodococcus sp. BP-321]MBY6424741.1 cytochrome P450 [Rhodococcus sp. BP-324]MBY6429226.1 cytochrome P450 [Rhodococcus sp. BP-323]MBY6434185.1 cytochrome P450 [Rhodococcus sp. BP-322]
MTLVHVWYGTESGNAEMVGDEIVDALKSAAVDAQLRELSDLEASDVADTQLAVVITSTYGEGGLPAGSEPFYETLDTERPDLSGLRFAAFGLGDSSYDNYNNAIKTLSSLLVELGATQIGNTGKHDATTGLDPVTVAREWADNDALPILIPASERAVTTTTEYRADLFPWSNKEFQNDPHPWYDKAREMGPVHQTDERTFVVLGYEEAMKFVKAPNMSIREPGWVEENPWLAFGHTVLSLDPPEHTRARRLFSKWFTPKLIKQWVEATRTSMNEILAGYEAGQTIDAHYDLGVLPTHTTMAQVLGFPDGEVEPLFWALWNAMLIQATDPAPGIREKSIENLDYMFNTTAALLEEKKANPGNGLADEMLAAAARGEVTDREVLENMVLFYMSGAPNPAYLVGAGFEIFAERPDVLRDFRDKPETRERIVNEIARLNPVELLLTRFPTEDVEIAGTIIPATSMVKFPIGAVNRDPAVFTNPHEFDYHRPIETSRNLTFGLGTHSCAGQMIARAEIDVIFTMIAERFSTVTLAQQPTRVITDRLVAYDKMPITLS